MLLSSMRRCNAVVTATALLIAVGCTTEPVPPDHKVASIDVTPKTVRMWIVGDSAKFTVAILTDAGTDGVGIPITWIARDNSLLKVTSSGVVTSLRKGGSTYVVAMAGGKSDSALVEVPTTPCGATARTTMAAGQVVTGIGANGFCVADSPDAEYTLIAFNSSLTSSATAVIEVIGQGLGATPTTSRASLASRAAFVRSTDLRSFDYRRRDVAGEAGFREAEVAALAPRVAAAQEWYRSRSGAALRAVVVPSAGDIVPMNVSMSTSATCPTLTTNTRVAAVSASAIVLTDINNPSDALSGAFTDADYASLAATFDTLINPLDTLTFGAPTDLDNNGRVIILFTREINKLTPAGSMTYVGGRTMQRDLFPKTGIGDATHPAGCAGSNVAEVFYMLVPDSAGTINGNSFPHSFVLSQTPVTIAHEYQHMINFSRRMYLLGLTSDKWADETWLHEGLSHTAEELLFHRASGLATRSNIGLIDLFAPDPSNRALNAFNDDMAGDFFLYDAYAGAAATSSPYRQVDDLTTRGATWSFLRYAMDQLGPTDGDLLHRLVNSGQIGLTNLQTQLGLSTAALQGMFRDFAVSVYADGYVSGIDARYTQPSWDMRSIYPGFNDPTLIFPIATTPLSDNASFATALVAGGFSVYRFKAVPGTDAFVRATGSAGSPMPPAITLSVIRTK
jgi:hypothetical protein